LVERGFRDAVKNKVLNHSVEVIDESGNEKEAITGGVI
jgi:uncharacterized protein YnzC (UPF0291/DUF896 family)